MKRSQPNRRSIRLQRWDYRNVGFYFVTICTHQREYLFADPILQKIATDTWVHIPKQSHARHISLDEWIVMPNHIHGIIEIVRPPKFHPPKATKPHRLQSGSIGAILGNYKMLVSKRVKAMRRLIGTDMKVWQRGYWERIIRNEPELNAIRRYIQENPLRWAEDRDNLDQLLNRMDYIK